MALSKPHTHYHSRGEHPLVRGEQGEKEVGWGIDEIKGGRRCMFHIKARSVISTLKNTEVKDFRHFTVDARACQEW